MQPGMPFNGGGLVAADGADGKTFLFYIPRHAVISVVGNLSINKKAIKNNRNHKWYCNMTRVIFLPPNIGPLT